MSKPSDQLSNAGRGRRIKGAMFGSEFIKSAHRKRSTKRRAARCEGAQACLIRLALTGGACTHSRTSTPIGRSWALKYGEACRKANKGERDQLENLKVWRMDARTVFANVLQHRTVDVVDVLFPTPWWDPALREKRLLITLDFLQDIAKVLKPGGCLRIETDVDSYADSISAELRQIEFKNVNAGQLTFALPCCKQLSRRQWRCKQDNLPTALAPTASAHQLTPASKQFGHIFEAMLF